MVDQYFGSAAGNGVDSVLIDLDPRRKSGVVHSGRPSRPDERHHPAHRGTLTELPRRVANDVAVRHGQKRSAPGALVDCLTGHAEHPRHRRSAQGSALRARVTEGSCHGVHRGSDIRDRRVLTQGGTKLLEHRVDLSHPSIVPARQLLSTPISQLSGAGSPNNGFATAPPGVYASTSENSTGTVCVSEREWTLVTVRSLIRKVPCISLARQLQHVRAFSTTARSSGLRPAWAAATSRSELLPPDHVDCNLELFTCFRDRLSIAGRVRSTKHTVIGVGIQPDQRRHIWLEPGLFKVDRDGWHRFSFDLPCSSGEIAITWRLCVAVDGGNWVDLGSVREKELDANPFVRTWAEFWSAIADRPSGSLLDLGGRARSGNVNTRNLPLSWKYVSFDIIDGPNVDVVGDAHELSKYFRPGSFDAVMSSATFEHLAMPWKVVVEISRVLKPGGLVCVATHQTWPVHDIPWDFWRFSEYSWRCLFNEGTGFEIVGAAMGETADVVPRLMSVVTAGMPGNPSYLGSIVVARKVSETTLDWDVPISVVSEGFYPA